MTTSVTMSLLWDGVCSYNNEGSDDTITHYCRRAKPISDEEADEREYRMALEASSPGNILDFLWEWGMMNALNWKKVRLWKLAEFVENAKRHLEPLATITLMSYSKAEQGSEVTELFNYFRERLGPVSAGKVLHILQPKLFVPWDRFIREVLDVDYYRDGKEYLDYLDLLDKSKSDLESLTTASGMSIREIQGTYYQDGWKPATKLLDELRWSEGLKLAPHFGTNRNPSSDSVPRL